MNHQKFRLLKLTSKPAQDRQPSRVTISDGRKVIHVYPYQGEEYCINNIIILLERDNVLVVGITEYKNQTYLITHDDGIQ